MTRTFDRFCSGCKTWIEQGKDCACYIGHPLGDRRVVKLPNPEEIDPYGPTCNICGGDVEFSGPYEESLHDTICDECLDNEIRGLNYAR